MLRNALIIGLSDHDNEPVVVKIAGLLVDVDAVTDEGECIALVLNPGELRKALDDSGAAGA